MNYHAVIKAVMTKLGFPVSAGPDLNHDDHMTFKDFAFFKLGLSHIESAYGLAFPKIIHDKMVALGLLTEEALQDVAAEMQTFFASTVAPSVQPTAAIVEPSAPAPTNTEPQAQPAAAEPTSMSFNISGNEAPPAVQEAPAETSAAETPAASETPAETPAADAPTETPAETQAAAEPAPVAQDAVQPSDAAQ